MKLITSPPEHSIGTFLMFAMKQKIPEISQFSELK
jgi:hypothetical protein